MPQDAKINVPSNTWAQLTNANVTAISFQVARATNPVNVRATVGTTPPASPDGSFSYSVGEGECNIPLSDMSPGIAANRVYAFSRNDAVLTVSHA